MLALGTMALAKIPPRTPRPNGRRRTSFKSGQSGNPAGRPPGAKNKLTEMKHQLIASSGMTPVEFLTFVYRDQLYDSYTEKLASDGRTTYFERAPNAKKIDVTLNQRISCALGAAPYIHKKMPVGIELKDKNTAIISTEKLRGMKEHELGALLDFMDKFGLSVDLASTSEVPALPGDST